MNIGYIGLGLMGQPCARNLLRAGYPLFVWARRKATTLPLVDLGAVACTSISEVATKSDILFINVSDTPDVEAILLGKDGVIHSGKKNLIVVDMSTISATATRRMATQLAEKGIELVDAPVSGGTIGAEKGALTIMVGASTQTFEHIKPVLGAMGTSITRIGECGAGQVAKSCNQIVITGTIAAVAEAFRFAEAAGADLAQVRAALLGGFANSRVLELHGQRMIDDTYTPGFKTALHCKDMGIVNAIAKEYNLPLPVSTIGLNLLEQALAEGFGEEDSSVIYRLVGEPGGLHTL